MIYQSSHNTMHTLIHTYEGTLESPVCLSACFGDVGGSWRTLHTAQKNNNDKKFPSMGFCVKNILLVKMNITAIVFYKYWQQFFCLISAVTLLANELQTCCKMMFKYYSGSILTENIQLYCINLSFDKIFMICVSYNKTKKQTSGKCRKVVHLASGFSCSTL